MLLKISKNGQTYFLCYFIAGICNFNGSFEREPMCKARRKSKLTHILKLNIKKILNNFNSIGIIINYFFKIYSVPMLKIAANMQVRNTFISTVVQEYVERQVLLLIIIFCKLKNNPMFFFTVFTGYCSKKTNARLS